MTVGQRIKFRRKALGMNAETLAERLGLAATTIYRYESGSIKTMGVDVIYDIAATLKCTPGDLLGSSPDDPSLPGESKKDPVEYEIAYAAPAPNRGSVMLQEVQLMSGQVVVVGIYRDLGNNWKVLYPGGARPDNHTEFEKKLIEILYTDGT